MISVDTKKKELVGAFRNGGREWRPEGEPTKVSTHDTPDQELARPFLTEACDVTAKPTTRRAAPSQSDIRARNFP